MEVDCLDSNPSFVTFELGDLGFAVALVFPSVKRGIIIAPT